MISGVDIFSSSGHSGVAFDGIAVDTTGSRSDKNALERRRSTQSRPNIKYAMEQHPLYLARKETLEGIIRSFYIL
jgi:hypothetical protein